MSKSMRKAFQLVELVAAGKTKLTDIATAAGLAPSSAHRLLRDLTEEGILRKDRYKYSLGVHLIELGEKAKRSLPLERAATEPMRDLARRTRETVHLGVLDGSDIVYLKKVESDRGLKMASYVGLRTPAQCTAMGKVLIAARDEVEWADHFRPVAPRTPRTILSLDEFLDELRSVREAGHAFDREENEVGIRCVAAPVRDASGMTVSGLSLSGATVYVSEERQEQLVPDVVACAQVISRSLGAT